MIELKKIYSNIIPFKGYTAMTVYPFVFIRKDKKDKYTAKVERHETTHAIQQIECYLVGAFIAIMMLMIGFGWWFILPIFIFWWWYLLEWFIKWFMEKFNMRKAYLSISFEQEAYDHQDEVFYNEVRKAFAWIRYVFELK